MAGSDDSSTAGAAHPAHPADVARLRPRGLGVATRLTLLFSLVGFVVVVVFGALSLRDEREDLLLAVEQQLRLLGEVVHISVENALRDEQAQDVTQILRAMESVDPSVSIFVVDAAGRVRAASWAGRGLDAVERAVVALTEPGGEPVYRVSHAERGQVALVALPLETAAGGDGWSVLLTRGLADVEEDLRRTSRRTWMTALSLLLLMVISGVGIGHIYIRRPLARLMAALDDVRDGGLRRKIEPLREDEFAQVAESFNRMALALDEAWRERDRQSDALRDLQLRLSSASRLAAVGQVSAGLAHEIGSPLQVIEGRAPAVLDGQPLPDAVFVGGGLSAALLESGCVRAGVCLGGGGGCTLNWIRVRPANSSSTSS